MPNVMIPKTNGEAGKPAVTASIKEAGKKPIVKITFDDEDINETNKNKSTSSSRHQPITYESSPLLHSAVKNIQTDTHFNIFTDAGYVEPHRTSISVYLSDEIQTT